MGEANSPASVGDNLGATDRGMNDRDAGIHALRSKGGEGAQVDALSDVLRVIRLVGGVFLEAEFTAPWCISGQVSADHCRPFLVTPKYVIGYHFIAAGRMQLRIAGGDVIDVRAGELILLPQNDAHLFGSHLDVQPMAASRVMQPPNGDGVARISFGGGGEATHMLCGFLGAEISFDPLRTALPSVLKVDIGATASGAWIESSFRFAANELKVGRVGSTTVIAKLSELLFVEAVTRHVMTLPAEQRGWLAGLRDSQIGRALALLHSCPTHDWTAEALASEVGMSRSAFAERFTSLIGGPPMQYLTQWRLHLAAQQLREGQCSIAQVAFDVGYESEAAFSRAFKRQFGLAPGGWRRGSRLSP